MHLCGEVAHDPRRCLVRHADATTHRAVDVCVAVLQALATFVRVAAARGGGGPAHADLAAELALALPSKCRLLAEVPPMPPRAAEARAPASHDALPALTDRAAAALREAANDVEACARQLPEADVATALRRVRAAWKMLRDGGAVSVALGGLQREMREPDWPSSDKGHPRTLLFVAASAAAYVDGFPLALAQNVLALEPRLQARCPELLRCTARFLRVAAHATPAAAAQWARLLADGATQLARLVTERCGRGERLERGEEALQAAVDMQESSLALGRAPLATALPLAALRECLGREEAVRRRSSGAPALAASALRLASLVPSPRDPVAVAALRALGPALAASPAAWREGWRADEERAWQCMAAAAAACAGRAKVCVDVTTLPSEWFESATRVAEVAERSACAAAFATSGCECTVALRTRRSCR